MVQFYLTVGKRLSTTCFSTSYPLGRRNTEAEAAKIDERKCMKLESLNYSQIGGTPPQASAELCGNYKIKAHFIKCLVSQSISYIAII